MIILKTSNFILFTLLIIIASIGIYIELFPCNCSSKKRNINIYRGKIKYVPIIIKDKKKVEKKKELNLKEEKCCNETNKIKNLKKSVSSASIGNHSSTHSNSIVPSLWNEDNEDEDFNFKY